MQYQRFVVSPSKSFLKFLFLGTKLGQALRKMSAYKAVPEGLKNQEYEKGNCKKWPPIPYVPIVDEVQEAVAKGKEISYKIKVPNKTEFSGTSPAFHGESHSARRAVIST